MLVLALCLVGSGGHVTCTGTQSVTVGSYTGTQSLVAVAMLPALWHQDNDVHHSVFSQRGSNNDVETQCPHSQLTSHH